VPPVPIPIGHVTRACYLWGLRGTARFDDMDVTVAGDRTLQRAPITRPGEPGEPAGAVTEARHARHQPR
jgi:hypothetical protein